MALLALNGLPVHRRVAMIEDALAEALKRGDFEVVHADGERFLRPILSGHVAEELIWTQPLLPLHAVAVELERLLS